MVRHTLLTLVGLTGLVVYIINIIRLNRKKDELNNPLYVSTRRREILLWLFIFGAILTNHVIPLWQIIFPS